MENREATCHFEPEVIEKMDEFERDFLANGYKKDTSENQGPNYRQRMAQDDTDAFGAYLESDYSNDFLNLK